jgi:hypothetical protein
MRCCKRCTKIVSGFLLGLVLYSGYLPITDAVAVTVDAVSNANTGLFGNSVNVLSPVAINCTSGGLCSPYIINATIKCASQGSKSCNATTLSSYSWP